MRQVVRAASFLRQKPWYDAVVYDGNHDDEMLVGEVRAIVRESTQDIAIICTWEPATSSPGCPFAARSCTRLKWATPDNPDEGDWCLRAVPVRSIRLLVHVVPDFSILPRARGVEALRAGRRAPVANVRQMRYFFNNCYTWGYADALHCLSVFSTVTSGFVPVACALNGAVLGDPPATALCTLLFSRGRVRPRPPRQRLKLWVTMYKRNSLPVSHATTLSPPLTPIPA